MKKKFKTMEVAKMFGISKQTLIFYHKKGVLVPEYIDPKNGYRYYSTQQIWELMFILTLKEAEFSLSEIAQYSRIKNIDKSIEFLENKMIDIDRKIESLKKSRKKIDMKIKSLKDVKREEQIEKVVKKDIFWYSIELKNPKDENEMALIYEKLRRVAKNNGIDYPIYITKTDLSNYQEGEIIPVKKIGILIEKTMKFSKEVEKIEKGKFLKLKHNSEYENIEKTYLKLLKEIKEKYDIKNPIFYEYSSEVFLQFEKGIGGIVEICCRIK